MFGNKVIQAAACAALLTALLAGCGQSTPATPPPTITPTPKPGPAHILSYNDCPAVIQQTEGPGTYDAGDGFDTVQRGPLSLNSPGCSSNVTNLDAAENWTFAGTTDQDIIIRIQAYGDADPQVTVIDPNGEVLDTSDNTDGTRSQVIEETLPLDGVYTLRVTMFAAGIYNIDIVAGTPEP